MVANWVDNRLPDRIKDTLLVSPASGKPTLLSLHHRRHDLARDRSLFLRYVTIYAMVFLSSWVAVFALFEVGKALGYPPPASAIGAIGLILLMPYFLTRGGYFYDYPELALFALASWMAVKCDWWWVVPVAALASWNKETFLIFALMLYPFLRIRNSRLVSSIGTAAMVSTCAFVDGLIWLRYRNNPTIQPSISKCLAWHLDYFRFFFMDTFREKTYGMPENNMMILVLLMLVVWTVWRGWRYLPRPARRHAQIGFIINLPLYFLFCTPGELRNFSLLYVSLFLLMTANFTEWMNKEPMEEHALSQS